jgi:tRNA G18 (ribose-2'-O)-methylase SpoU
VEQVLQTAEAAAEKRAARIAVLENVMNPANVGSIFRNAAALGIDAVLLTDGCSDPLYRRTLRVSMGTTLQIPWTWIGRSIDEWKKSGLQMLKDRGYQTIAMALREDAVQIRNLNLGMDGKAAVILGAEGDGLLPETIEGADRVTVIPMARGVDSLNVAAASAIAFFEIGRRTQY